jgi:hypothetical protein
LPGAYEAQDFGTVQVHLRPGRKLDVDLSVGFGLQSVAQNRLIDLGELRLRTEGLGHDRDGQLLLRVGSRYRSEPKGSNGC